MVGGTLLALSLGLAVLIRTVGIFRTPRVSKSDAEELSSWRTNLLNCIYELNAVSEENAIWAILDRFAQHSGFFVGQCEIDGEMCWSWESEDSEAEEGMRGFVSCAIPLETQDSETVRFRFGWYCDAGKVLRHEFCFIYSCGLLFEPNQPDSCGGRIGLS